MGEIARNATRYDEDFVVWTAEQAALLSAGDLSRLDLDNLAEEIESLGASNRRELRRRLARLIQHLLEYRYQPDRRSRSWAVTIDVQRAEIADMLEESPCLRRTARDVMAGAFTRGRVWALEETGLLTLPEECPWTVEQVLSGDVLPE